MTIFSALFLFICFCETHHYYNNGINNTGKMNDLKKRLKYSCVIQAKEA